MTEAGSAGDASAPGSRDRVGWFDRLFRGSVQRDGQAHALEALATDIDLEGSPSALAAGAAPGPRRHGRPVEDPRTLILDALAQKTLDAWLQNRHQTLYPLTLNLQRLEPQKAELVLGAMALAMNSGEGVAPERLERVRTWLGAVGATPELQDRLAPLVDDPPALRPTLQALQQADLSAYAYASALMSTDPQDAAAESFAAYLAIRLALPPTVVRSLQRRYRG